MQRWQKTAQSHPALLVGSLAGLVGLAFSFAGRGLIPGRVLGDPLPLALAIGQITRSFLYFNWSALLWHALFAALLGLLVVLLLRWLTDGYTMTGDAAQAATIASAINLAIVALTEVDALMVAFWYLMASFISYTITTSIARQLARRLLKRV